MWLAVVALLLQSEGASTPDNVNAVPQSSARCVAVTASADERLAPPLKIAPGPPPLLSFRYYEGQLHHRYTNSDLMLDDAGH